MVSDEIEWEYITPFKHTPTEMELLGRLLAHGCAIWPTRLMTAEEIADIYGVAPIANGDK